MNKFFANILKKWQLILYISLILGAMTFLVSTVITPKYKSEITVLIVQKRADILTASKNAEYLGNVFEQVLYTESFMDGVLKTDPSIKRQFSKDAKKRKSQWEDEIRSEKIGSTGMLKIAVFDPSNEDSYKIALGIAKNFQENSAEYFGQKEQVETKVIDGPITSSKVAYPNIVLNTVGGLLIGLFGSLVIVYFFEEFDLRLVGNAKTKRKRVDFAEESQIERQVGEQLARQLEKRNDRASLEYLEVANEAAPVTDAVDGSLLDVESEFEEDLLKEEKATPKDQNELEYIEIDESKEFPTDELPVEKIEDESQDYVEEMPFRLKESESSSITFQKNDAIEVFKDGEGDGNFWQNMRAIDDMADKAESGNDNPLLADYMVDMDTYNEIIKAGETYKGFKKMQEKGQVEGVKEILKLQDTEENKRESKKEDSFKGSVAKHTSKESSERSPKKKEKADSLEVSLKKEKREAEAFVGEREEKKAEKRLEDKDVQKESTEKIELSSVGLKTLKEDKVTIQKEEKKQKKSKEGDAKKKLVAKKDKSADKEKVSQETKLISDKQKDAAKKSPFRELAQKGKVNESEKHVLEEELEKIVQQKKALEKKEIEELIAKDDKIKTPSGSKLKDKTPKERISEGVEQKKSEKKAAVKEIAAVESIDFIGDVADSDKREDVLISEDELFGVDDIKEENFKEQKSGNVFSRLYGKSIFSDKKYKKQKEKRTTHHMEMDPEELDMMRRMLEAEGKSEEEFIVENGLMPKEETRDNLEPSDEDDKDLATIKVENAKPVKESVRKIKPPKEILGNILNKKASAPKDLPVFIEQEDQQDAFARELAKKAEGVKKEKELKKPVKKAVDPNKEVSEEEIKTRLNKLLQGEM